MTGGKQKERVQKLPQTTAICAHCGAWDHVSVASLSFMSPRYELPCQRCGAIFRVGDAPAASDLRYFAYWTAVHRAGVHPSVGFRLDDWTC